jgi:hypothetical protein
MSDQPSVVDRLTATWNTFQGQAKILANLQDDLIAYRHKQLRKAAFLGSIFGFLLESNHSKKTAGCWSDSLDALIIARFEVTKKPFFFYAGAIPCATVAILTAFQDVETMFWYWPGLTDLFRDLCSGKAMDIIFPGLKYKDDEFDPQELLCRWVEMDEGFGSKVRAFPGRALSRSLLTAFRDINLSRITSSAGQEYTYALMKARSSQEGLIRDNPPLLNSTETILAHGDRLYSIGNFDPVQLNEMEDAVLQGFVRRPAMDHATLQRVIGYPTEAILATLRRLRTKYEERFAPAIIFAGRRGNGGYRVRVTTVQFPA